MQKIEVEYGRCGIRPEQGRFVAGGNPFGARRRKETKGDRPGWALEMIEGLGRSVINGRGNRGGRTWERKVSQEGRGEGGCELGMSRGETDGVALSAPNRRPQAGLGRGETR